MSKTRSNSPGSLSSSFLLISTPQRGSGRRSGVAAPDLVDDARERWTVEEVDAPVERRPAGRPRRTRSHGGRRRPARRRESPCRWRRGSAVRRAPLPPRSGAFSAVRGPSGRGRLWIALIRCRDEVEEPEDATRGGGEVGHDGARDPPSGAGHDEDGVPGKRKAGRSVGRGRSARLAAKRRPPCGRSRRRPDRRASPRGARRRRWRAPPRSRRRRSSRGRPGFSRL